MKSYFPMVLFEILGLLILTKKIWAKSPHFGVDINILAGVGHSYVAGSSIDGMALGGRAAYHLNSEWSLGFSYITYPMDFGANHSNSSYSFVLSDMSYQFANSFRPLTLGAILGIGTYILPGLISLDNFTTINGPSYQQSSLAAGIRIEYSFALSDRISVGPLVQFIMTFGNLASNSFQGYGVVRYSF